jgi:enoyl-CoA hydratase/carnithine racemase
MADAAGAQAVVLLREQPTTGGMKLGLATLNSEKTLNALSLDMVRALDAQLIRWANDPTIACVVLDGAGEKAFCAGGDVRFLREATLAHQADQGAAANPAAQAFFSEEYALDYRIHTYPKPILIWGGGIVMGGGLGLLAGASHRVVTETSRIAMPEITIGFYPDVGGSWFLRRMPGKVGLFLALTGAAVNAHDALVVDLADFFLKNADRPTLVAHLAELKWGSTAAENHAILSKALRAMAARAQGSLPNSNVRTHADTIQRLMDGDTLAETKALIEGYRGEDSWLKRASSTLASGSPTSAALIWEIWRRAHHMGLADVFRMELIVSLQCCRHPDFAEGVRALLIDKDNRPRWTPPTLDEVTPAWVEEHFLGV